MPCGLVEKARLALTSRCVLLMDDVLFSRGGHNKSSYTLLAHTVFCSFSFNTIPFLQILSNEVLLSQFLFAGGPLLKVGSPLTKYPGTPEPLGHSW